jgi:hypothetical protein
MIYYITVIDRDSQTVLFAGNSRDRSEIEQVAAEARRLRPKSQILIQPPIGKPIEFP